MIQKFTSLLLSLCIMLTLVPVKATAMDIPAVPMFANNGDTAVLKDKSVDFILSTVPDAGVTYAVYADEGGRKGSTRLSDPTASAASADGKSILTLTFQSIPESTVSYYIATVAGETGVDAVESASAAKVTVTVEEAEETASPAIIAVDSESDAIGAVLQGNTVILSGILPAPADDTLVRKVPLVFTYLDADQGEQVQSVDITLSFAGADGEKPASWIIETAEVTVVDDFKIAIDGSVAVKAATECLIYVESETEGITAALNDKKDIVTLSGELPTPSDGTTDSKVSLVFMYTDAEKQEQTQSVDVILNFVAVDGEAPASWVVKTAKVAVTDSLKIAVDSSVAVKAAVECITGVESETEGITVALNDKKDTVILSGELPAPSDGTTDSKVSLVFMYTDAERQEQTQSVDVILNFVAVDGEAPASWVVETEEVAVTDSLKIAVDSSVAVKNVGKIITAVKSKTEGIMAVLNDKKDAVILSGELSTPDTDVTADTISLIFTYTDEKGILQAEEVDIGIEYTPTGEEMSGAWKIMSKFVEICRNRWIHQYQGRRSSFREGIACNQ